MYQNNKIFLAKFYFYPSECTPYRSIIVELFMNFRPQRKLNKSNNLDCFHIVTIEQYPRLHKIKIKITVFKRYYSQYSIITQKLGILNLSNDKAISLIFKHLQIIFPSLSLKYKYNNKGVVE